MTTATNTEQARFNMVEQQIRTWNVLDPDILDLLFTVKREEFVPAAYRSLAFADIEIPLGPGAGQQMWSPKLEARVLQELQVLPTDEVLEIGTGSGYLSALLAHRATRVTSVEIDAGLAGAARARLAAHNLTGVLVETGDGARGWREPQMFDVIVLTGSTPELADALIGQLKPGGRLFAIVGVEPAMHGRLVTKGISGQPTTVDLFETVVAPLVNAPHPERFVF
ncbi:MAG: protein-L-isoaspartate O-methyltransferase [Betaproteobacteria bacterium]